MAAAKPCDAARRCLQLQSWHDCAVQGTVAVAKPCDAARRCVHLQDWHDSAVQKHCACGNLAAQREDACIARRPRLRGARRRACEKILRCNARMPAPAGLARQRGARHRGGGQTLRWLASVWMSSLLDLTPCSALCGLCILVDTTNATFFTHAAGLRDCCFLARQNVGHLGYDGFEKLEIFL